MSYVRHENDAFQDDFQDEAKTMMFPLVHFEHLQTLGTWPCLGLIPKIVLHKKKKSTKTSKLLG
jgi:hypothetical protein